MTVFFVIGTFFGGTVDSINEILGQDDFVGKDQTLQTQLAQYPRFGVVFTCFKIPLEFGDLWFNILSGMDHPFVIVNESCLSSQVDTASSCRHTSCYTGLLIDLLHQIDGKIKNLNNCTIQGVEKFGNLSNKGSSLSKNDTVEIIERGEAEVALVALENVHLYKVIRVLSFIERIKGTEFPYMLSIGFPTSSEDPRGRILSTFGGNRTTPPLATGGVVGAK
ncbi:hypothetical protein Fcan01_17457 [Folsomia candida]|uniref:Uncharacterized protein n=1 Tax=Folsomia candida TaxID=158441 RepID=A0A226DUV5_FOLCA|nr:hypothetical protein Fcan01_17457 [Folsomia candida]